MDNNFSSEEERAEQEQLRQEEEKLRKELANKWKEERLLEAEKIFQEEIRDRAFQAHYYAELSKRRPQNK